MSPHRLVVRPATEADVPALTAIYNEVIATTTAVFADAPVEVKARREWLQARQACGYPVLVACDGAGLAGFASFGDFRAWPGYRMTVEHSVHVAAGRRGQGVGRLLMQSLIPMAAGQGKHMMIAGVDAANQPSLRFHESLGFQPVGVLKEVGFKFGRYLDLCFMQLRLDG